ncbi:Crp/Fnr family transcriptional regulator [Streptomyces sp. NPDC058665]|uniref:Crp/Fnr family transcriptional regulator n=1 Tax=Streptomyces sp. NPDC058665 TaxID=3346586 RepID=UPI00364FEB01
MDVDRHWEKVFAHGTTRPYLARQPMLLKGSPSESVLRVLEGWALVTDPHADGSSTFLELRGRGQLLGETSALSGEPRNANVTAVCRTIVRAVPSDLFLAAVTAHKEIQVGMILHAQDLHRTSNVRAGLRSFGVIRGLSRLLLDLVRTAGAPLVAGIPQKVLAHALGVTSRTLRDAFAELERRRVLSVRWPVVDITDEAVLKELARSEE